jgi:hypothetical protein
MIEFSHGFVSISPDRPVPLAGRAGSPRVVGDVQGTLEANILAVFSEGICRAVFVSIDAVFVGRELSDILLSACADFGVANETVLIVATHTHSAPALENTKPALGSRCDDHFADVRKKLTRLVSDVLTARPQQGKITKGRSSINASVNRRLPWHLPQLTRGGIRFERIVFAPNGSGAVDPLVTAVIIQGESTAVVWHYTCHPTGFPEEKMSADYPGIVRQALRYLSKDRCNQFNLANSHSRALFRRHLLLAASELENDLYQSGRVVMMQRSSIKTGRFRTTKLSSTLRPLNRRSEMHLPEWII